MKSFVFLLSFWKKRNSKTKILHKIFWKDLKKHSKEIKCVLNQFSKFSMINRSQFDFGSIDCFNGECLQNKRKSARFLKWLFRTLKMVRWCDFLPFFYVKLVISFWLFVCFVLKYRCHFVCALSLFLLKKMRVRNR